MFEILATEEVFGWTIATVSYPGCTTHGGIKLLVYATTQDVVRAQKVLDPHFTVDEGLSPVARFEPTKLGHRLAHAACIAGSSGP